MAWPTIPELGGLSVRRDLNIGIHDPPSGVVMATCINSVYVCSLLHFCHQRLIYYLISKLDQRINKTENIRKNAISVCP